VRAPCNTIAMTARGPKRQFAAVQRHGRCRWNTGRSVDVADTAALDPLRKSSDDRPRRPAPVRFTG
jgi:hypothetical protein